MLNAVLKIIRALTFLLSIKSKNINPVVTRLLDHNAPNVNDIAFQIYKIRFKIKKSYRLYSIIMDKNKEIHQ